MRNLKYYDEEKSNLKKLSCTRFDTEHTPETRCEKKFSPELENVSNRIIIRKKIWRRSHHWDQECEKLVATSNYKILSNRSIILLDWFLYKNEHNWY